MTFYEARFLSRTGLHIRREAWEDKHIIVWRGGWWTSIAGVLRPLQTTDYTLEDITADDWTTMPKELEDCPITPPPTDGGGSGGVGGSTGGGSGTPGSGGFPPYEPPSGRPPMFSGGSVPGSPLDDRGPCNLGTITLEATENCPSDAIDCEVTIAGFTPGDYSVVFRAGTAMASGGIITGGAGTASGELTGLAEWKDSALEVSVTITGLGADNPCRGTVSKKITSFNPFCPTCTSSTTIVVVFTGIQPKSDPDPELADPPRPDPNGTYTLTFNLPVEPGFWSNGVADGLDSYQVLVGCDQGEYFVQINGYGDDIFSAQGFANQDIPNEALGTFYSGGTARIITPY